MSHLRDKFILHRKTDRIQFYLISGIRLVGTLIDSDDEVYIVDDGHKGPQLLERRAVATVSFPNPKEDM